MTYRYSVLESRDYVKNDKLNKDINTDLFNLYKQLPADFRQTFSYIKADTQRGNTAAKE